MYIQPSSQFNAHGRLNETLRYSKNFKIIEVVYFSANKYEMEREAN